MKTTINFGDTVTKQTSLAEKHSPGTSIFATVAAGKNVKFWKSVTRAA
jgi:hypothetical protein